MGVATRSGSCVKEKSERTSGYDVMTLPVIMRPIQNSYTALPSESKLGRGI